MSHLTENMLLDLGAGLLSPTETATVEAHLDTCHSCRRLVGALARDEAPSSGGSEEVLPERGASVGRYLIIERLGAGNMGVVFAAYDSVLSRKVALKFLRSDRRGEGAEARSRRLLREAQALASVSHPNVVSVHDVGEWGTQVFIAMEFIDGDDLATSLAQRPRSLEATIELFRDAGEGLAAIHAVGLVHRDFKTSNVLVDGQGRVRVTDLGLARADGPMAIPDTSALAHGLTLTGEVLGTPAYMAPEQYRGEPVDARSDQFAFCVALYEAVYHRLPFGVLPVEALAKAVQAGQVEAEPSDATVPAWLRRVLLKGLSVRPDDRFPSMHALVLALGNESALRRRRRWRIAGVTALTVAMAASWVVAVSPSATVCRQLDAPLLATWNPAVRVPLHEHLRTALGARSAEAIDAELERYARAWATQRTEVCEATHLRGEQSEALMEVRNDCLEHRLNGFTALVGALQTQPVKVLGLSAEAVFHLDDLSSCADLTELRLQEPPPPQLRAESAALDQAMAVPAASNALGLYVTALGQIEPLMDRGRALQYPPTRARLLLLYGTILRLLARYAEAEPVLEAALQDAFRARNFELAAEVATQLAFDVGDGGLRRDDGLRWAALGKSLLEGRRTASSGHADLLRAEAAIYRRASDYTEALRSADAALAELARLPSPAPLIEASTHNERANALGRLLRGPEAAAEYRISIAAYDAILGPGSAPAGRVLSNLCAALRATHPEEALATCEKALQSAGAAELPLTERIRTLINQSGVRSALKDPEGALESFNLALSLLDPEQTSNWHQMATLLNGRANVYDDLHRTAEAEADYRKSAELREKVLGPDHENVAESLFNLAGLLRRADRCAEAVPLYVRILNIDERRLGSENEYVAAELEGLGACYVRTDQLEKGLTILERALTLAEKLEHDPELLGLVRSSISMALKAQNRDPIRAARLAVQAEPDLITCGAPCSAQLDRLRSQRKP